MSIPMVFFVSFAIALTTALLLFVGGLLWAVYREVKGAHKNREERALQLPQRLPPRR